MGTVPSSLSASTAALNHHQTTSANTTTTAGSNHLSYDPAAYLTYSRGSAKLNDRKNQLVINPDQLNNRFELLIKEKNMQQLSEYIKVNSSNVALATAAAAVAATGVTLNDPLATKALNDLGIRQHRSNSYCFSSLHKRDRMDELEADVDGSLDESDEYERNFNHVVDKVRGSMYANCDEFDEYEADLNEQYDETKKHHPLASVESFHDEKLVQKENDKTTQNEEDEETDNEQDDTEFDMTTTTLSLNTTSSNGKKVPPASVLPTSSVALPINLVNENTGQDSNQSDQEAQKSADAHQQIEYFSLKPVLMTTYQYKAPSPTEAAVDSFLSNEYTSSNLQSNGQAQKAATVKTLAPNQGTSSSSSNNTSSSGCSSGMSSNSSSSSSHRRYHCRHSNLQQQLNIETNRMMNQSNASQTNTFNKEPTPNPVRQTVPGQELLVLRQHQQQHQHQHVKVVAPPVDVASASACLFLNNKMSHLNGQSKMLFLSTVSPSSLIQSPSSLSTTPSPIFGPISSNDHTNTTSHFSSSSTTSASITSSAKKSINCHQLHHSTACTPESELSLSLVTSANSSLRAKLNKKLRLSKSGILSSRVEMVDTTTKESTKNESNKMKKKSSLNSFSTLFLNRLGINYITKSNGSTEESTVRGTNRHKDKDRMKTKSECIYLTKESGSKKSATTDVPSKSLYFNNLEQDEDKTDEEENEEDAFRGSTLVENHQRSSPSIGAFKSNPNLTETKSSSRKKGSDGIKRFKKGLNKKLNRKFGSGKSSSTKNVDESSSKKSRQASTPSHRDSGIIADIFSNIGSMNNIKSKFNSAKSSLRNSLSVFSLKVSTSINLNGIDLGTGTVTGVSSSSSSSTKSASLVSKKKKSSCPPNSEPVSTFTSSSVHNFDHGSSMMLISDTVGAGSAASAVTASNSTSSSNHHHQHHHHQSFTSSTNSSANSNRLDMLSKEARADRIHNANQKFDANINSKSMSNLNKYSIYSTKSTASSSSTKSSSVLSSSVLSAASSCMSSSSSTSSRDGAIEKDEQTSRQQQQHRMLLRRSVTGEYDEDENNNADEEDGDEEEEGEDREQEESEAERRLVDLQQQQDANEISKNNSMRERTSKSEEFEIKIQNETDQIHQQKATKMNATRDEFFVIKNKLNEMNNSARNKKSIDEGAAAAATVATQYFSNQMHNKFKLSQQQQQQQQALSVSSNKLSMNANGSYYTYLPRNKASLQAQLGQRQPQSKSFKMPDQRQLGQENTASLRRTTTFHSTKTNPSNLFEASVRKYSTSDENSNAKSTLRPGSVLANRVNCNCNQCKKDSQHMPTGFTSSLKSTKSNHSTHLSSILKQPTTQTVSTTQQRITADHLRPKNYGSFSATSNSSYNTLNLSSFNVNNSTNNRASPSQQKQFQQQYVPSSGANKFTSSMSSTTLFTTTSNKPSTYQCSHDKMESQTIVSSTSLPPVEKSDGTAMEQQASNTEQPMAKTSEVTTTIRMTSTSSVKGVAEMADSNSTSNSSFNSRHQKVVVQASTSDLLRCFATFISHRCAHLIRSSSESSASGHHHSQRSASNKFDPRDTIIWLRSADRVLLAQGWQEIQFMNPVNVVFVYLLMRESLKPSEIKTVYDLQCNIMACLYLAFSYMGNEISYPLKPFIIEENRDVFWQRTVNLMNQLSGCMLKINQDPRFFTELFYELRSYSNVNLLTPSKTLTSIPNTANHSFKKPINQKPTTNNKPSEVNMATAAPTVDAKPEQPTVAKHNNSTASCNSHTPAYTSSAPAAVSYSLSTSSIASKLASSQPFHQQLKLSTFTFNTKQQQLTDVCSNTMSSPSGISGKAHVSSTSSNATPASAPPPTIANNKSNGNSEIRYRQFNQLYNQFNRPDVLTQLN